ncbi:MAG: ATP-binding cassette domain-containing protein [Candidatus Omnitrophota bacterium]
MIKIRNLNKQFDEKMILSDINLDVAEAEIVAILGPSGSGKSVFLRHLIGLLKPDSGTIEIDSVDMVHVKEKELLKMRKNIGYLFQEGALFDFMTIYENLAFPLEEHTHLSHRQIDEKIKEMLKLVGLHDVEHKFPVELSGGMRKRAALARAVILGTKFLFCDEPTSGLDPIRSFDISNLIKDISRRLHCTTIITSHDIPNSLRMADRLVIIHEGRFVAIGTQKELLSSKDAFIQEFLNRSCLNNVLAR